MPSTVSVANQRIITGPKTAPTVAVPKRWKANMPTRITTVMGTIQWVRAGAATSSPSTAPSTEIAGVIIPSP